MSVHPRRRAIGCLPSRLHCHLLHFLHLNLLLAIGGLSRLHSLLFLNAWRGLCRVISRLDVAQRRAARVSHDLISVGLAA